jgi:hypothetical protein
MNRPPQGHGQGGLGATWMPGGDDQYFIPEVISPSPQRCDRVLPSPRVRPLSKIDTPHNHVYINFPLVLLCVMFADYRKPFVN